MTTLHDKDTQALIGAIDEGDLQFLKDQLEEEGLEDRDYAITPLLLDVWGSEGSRPALVAMLREALGERAEMNIVWSDE
jgi:hypothetical protein